MHNIVVSADLAENWTASGGSEHWAPEEFASWKSRHVSGSWSLGRVPEHFNLSPHVQETATNCGNDQV